MAQGQHDCAHRNRIKVFCQENLTRREMMMKTTEKIFPSDMPEIDGIKGAATSCGLKKSGKDDLVMITLPPSSVSVSAFTSSRCPSAPVLWSRDVSAVGSVRVVIANAGNSNAMTGAAGHASVRAIATAAAKIVGCAPNQVFIASTGVVGEPLPAEKIIQALPRLARQQTSLFWEAAAKAIMTTDTRAKGDWNRFAVDGQNWNIAGIAKGAGMIAPNMATTLSFIFTDMPVSRTQLDRSLHDAIKTTFNAITVDGDMSPSDTIFLAGPTSTPAKAKAMDSFAPCLLDVMRNLARDIARDAEGASKLMTVEVAGMPDDETARRMAMQIANSPLVKTALAGEDPNWGRIAGAIGAAGIDLDPDRIALAICGFPVLSKGELVPNYDERPLARAMKARDIDIRVDLGLGDGRFTVWSCDLTEDYIRINADYRS